MIQRVVCYTGVNSFKMTVYQGNMLRLNCSELHTEFQDIPNESVCAHLANLFENANALSFDDSNKKCSIQQCTNNSNMLAEGVATSNVSIIFESVFYLKCKFTHCFNYNRFI